MQTPSSSQSVLITVVYFLSLSQSSCFGITIPNKTATSAPPSTRRRARYYQHLFCFQVTLSLYSYPTRLRNNLPYCNTTRKKNHLDTQVWSDYDISIPRVYRCGFIFTVGIDVDTRAYFTSATIIIAIPTGVKETFSR